MVVKLAFKTFKLLLLVPNMCIALAHLSKLENVVCLTFRLHPACLGYRLLLGHSLVLLGRHFLSLRTVVVLRLAFHKLIWDLLVNLLRICNVLEEEVSRLRIWSSPSLWVFLWVRPEVDLLARWRLVLLLESRCFVSKFGYLGLLVNST